MKKGSEEIGGQSAVLSSIKNKRSIPMLSIVGFSGSGKTTLMVKVITEMRGHGFRVGTVKHDVHGFEMDQSGKDSWRHKKAGASTTIITSPTQIGMVMDVNHDHQPMDLLPLMKGMDIVLAEGFKWSDLPKIEVFRSESGRPPACRSDKNLLAVVSDEPLDWEVPRFETDDISGLVNFILERFDLTPFANSELRTATG
ncbi:MAG: molybdopterin-guanine dinucleotide biosynthesis protein B [Deltaproteobacteria bacterium]|nr:molybdopterin-guanine dinucleotide biosynthesis protein B [Deltaproteobacteria bacterium]MBW2601977.1 molybdopterin-guanine dinucleotide biosynthesis protein B [Deltaproteobacteria bacterium]